MTIVIGNLPRVVASVFGVVFFATIGVLCLFRTAAVRDFALRNAAKKIGSMSNPASSWMQTSQYVWSLRLIGVLSIGAVVLLLLTAIRSRD